MNILKNNGYKVLWDTTLKTSKTLKNICETHQH